MRGHGGTAAEPVGIEMSDEAAGLVAQAISIAVTVNDLAVDHGGKAIWTAGERSALVSAQAAIREMSLRLKPQRPMTAHDSRFCVLCLSGEHAAPTLTPDDITQAEEAMDL